MSRPSLIRRLWRRALTLAGLVCVGSTIMLIVLPDRWFGRTPDVQLAHHLANQVMHGHLNGQFDGHPISVDEYLFSPGDILLCHNPHGGYGYWTHAVLYVGKGRVVDSNDFVRGTVTKSLFSYRAYQELALVRVATTNECRQRAADDAVKDVGKPYNPFSSLQDKHSEYCSKLIWQVFQQEGVNLWPVHHWILPDDLAHSPKIRVIARWGTAS